ncbi:30S ribosomal protein S7 [Patescibacteria group bacterium]|nr:30S ribosomal protein S7 [Patescibacteria group bacterium]MBU1519449.1 30S ribosomal protein S7 [Patescibacteria group bacterium]MBU2461238.1 30S ribosomal protein S7 [Patescibacteria group bacterium]
MRRKVKNRKQPQPDRIYESAQVAKFINKIMQDGKKTVAQTIVYKAFDLIKEKTKEKPLEIFELALKNVGPLTEVRSRRVGGANYQVPCEVRPERSVALAMRWILKVVRTGKGSPTYKRLADELILASKNEGEAIKKKENTHKMAEANKAFAHFAW